LMPRKVFTSRAGWFFGLFNVLFHSIVYGII
jgi:hypothetical protein